MLRLALSQETVDTGDDGEGGSCSSSGGHSRSEPGRRRRRRRKQQRLARTVVNPDENFYFYWLMLLTVCVLYNVWTLIVRQSFPELQVCTASHPYEYQVVLSCSSPLLASCVSISSFVGHGDGALVHGGRHL